MNDLKYLSHTIDEIISEVNIHRDLLHLLLELNGVKAKYIQAKWVLEDINTPDDDDDEDQ